jgi:hypothetical protein
MRWRVILVAALVLAGLIWLASRVSQWRAAGPADPTGIAASLTESNRDPQGLVATNGATGLQPTAPSNSGGPLPLPPLPWDMRRDALLRSEAPASEKADRLLGMLPDLAPADQEEAARHLINLLADDRFASAGAWLTNAQAPEAVQGLLMADLMNRPDKVRLPLYLLIAQTPGHPRAAEARYLLSVHLPDDHGTNWPAWEAAVLLRLQEQAEK